MWIPVLLAASLAAPADDFPVLARLDVGRAPHQITFAVGPDGTTAYVAVAGSDRVVELDATTRAEVARHEVAGTPLGVARPADGGGLLVTCFARDSVVRTADGEELVIGEGPSFLVPVGASPGTPEGRLLAACERADRLVVLAPEPLSVAASFPTGARPFPPAATSDGRLAFVPNHDDGTVTPIDLWNERAHPPVSVGARPTGGAVLPGDVEYAVAVRGEDRIAFVNTASRTVVGSLEEGIGASPFSVVVAPNGRLAFVNNTASGDVSAVDLAARRVVARFPVGDLPIALAVRPDGRELWVACEGSHEVVVVGIPEAWSAPVEPPPRTEEPTPVAVLGMIHGAHRTSERFGLDELEAAIRRYAPEVVLTEIPPDRWERIRTDWTERGALEDDRIRLFPEYTDVLLPLMGELGFEVVPCAAWTRELADLRRARIEAFENEERHAERAAAYARASEAAAAEPAPGPEDDPLVIHSRAYDEWTRRTLEPYDRYLNDWIGPGGWTNVNAAHMALVDRALDRHAGRRVLITFGAGHKHWFLDRLRERDDVRLVDVAPYLPVAMDSKTEAACRTEIAELHRFFEAWFAGELPDTDQAFARFAEALDESFEIVSPAGVKTGRADLLRGLRRAHGSSPDGALRIWTRDEQSRPAGDGLLIATYEEWQESAEGRRGRLSTAVFRRDGDAANGLRWLHVHETWMDR